MVADEEDFKGEFAMPRIYYNQSDYEVNLLAFIAHALAYIIGIVLLWLRALPYADSFTILWTMLLAYHSYWRSSLVDGMQFRTYTRLRNRFGKDWDLAASREEFDLERKKAALELKLKHVLPDSTYALVIAAASIIGLIILSDMPLVPIALMMLTGWLMTLISLQVVLRYQLRQNQHRYDVLKTKQSKHSSTLTQTKHLQDYAAKTFAVGDDGELIEVGKKGT